SRRQRHHRGGGPACAATSQHHHVTLGWGAYPLAGLIISGFGTHAKPTGGHPPVADPPPSHVNIPVAVKDSTLLLPHLRDFAEALPLSARVDTILLPGAPHNLELSYQAPGWYAQSFGFASERAASLVLGKAGEST
ncbi:hypothetical protein SEUCBS140593_005884, partial [Sporothrix eucalyptigena]